MAIQDLTPQLRTRLSRVERVVGLFVTVATLLLLIGFGYYVYNTGQRKGWWVAKFPYHTFVQSGSGLKIGGAVKLLGFDVGEVTKVEAMAPFSTYGNVYVEFVVRAPYQGYVWDDSRVKLIANGFLGDRTLELIPGGTYKSTNLHSSYRMEGTKGVGVWNDKEGRYDPFTKTSKGYGLMVDESPAVTERLEMVANQVQAALPGIMDLTNKLALVLSNAANMTAQGEKVMAEIHPVLANVNQITANLKEPKGSLGDWLFPTNLNSQLETTLDTANLTLTNASITMANTDSNLTKIATGLDLTLINVANMTSNLNQQVQANTNLVKSISDLIVNSDQMVQGLKTHWLLRSAFKTKEPPAGKKNKETKSDKESNKRGPVKAGKRRD